MVKVKLKVQGLTSSQIQSGAYALILAEEKGPYRIPIIVGTTEAQSIAIALERLIPPRPLTHDLFVTFTHSFGILLQEVFIYKFIDGIFFSELVLFDGERQVRIDSRTSDAIALALRLRTDIYTTDDIIKECGIILEEINDNSKEDLESEENDFLDDYLSDTEGDEDYADDEMIEEEITPDNFLSEKNLKKWLSYLSVEELEKRLKETIETENYEHAKIYKDELERRREEK